MLLFRNTKTWFESMVGSKATKQLEHVFLYVYRQNLGTNRTVQIKSQVSQKDVYTIKDLGGIYATSRVLRIKIQCWQLDRSLFEVKMLPNSRIKFLGGTAGKNRFWEAKSLPLIYKNFSRCLYSQQSVSPLVQSRIYKKINICCKSQAGRWTACTGKHK